MREDAPGLVDQRRMRNAYAMNNYAEAKEALQKITGEYAQQLLSTPAKHDGLYWPASEAQPPSLFGQLGEFPKSSRAAASKGQQLVSDGYKLRILTAQGNDAPGGAQTYVVNGKMSGGFAILATPVRYGDTGIMTFMMNDNGIVYERNLGARHGQARRFNHTIQPG